MTLFNFGWLGEITPWTLVRALWDDTARALRAAGHRVPASDELARALEAGGELRADLEHAIEAIDPTGIGRRHLAELALRARRGELSPEEIARGICRCFVVARVAAAAGRGGGR